MKITVLRKMQYKGTFIYVMQFGFVFQYLFSWEGGEIFQNNITLLPRLWKRILWRLRLIKNIYTREQLEEGEKIILSGAMATIDEIDSPGFKAKRRKSNQEAQAKARTMGCVWQAREAKDGMYYLCLVHGKAVKMKDGEKPSHN